jgi:two-component system cell cycle response regulator
MSDHGQMTILVADDEPDILAIIRVILRSAGYRVVTASDGLEAVKLAYREMPDGIILDVMMPLMNGYQVCRLLKYDTRTRGIPVVLCTVKSLEMDRLYGMTSGADAYVTKPFEAPQLLAAVQGVLEGRAPRRREEAPHAVETSTDTILSRINLILDQKLREYTILQHLGRAITGTLELNALLTVVLRSVSVDLGYSHGLFLMKTEEGIFAERASVGSGGNESWSGSDAELAGVAGILESGEPAVVSAEEVSAIFPQAIRQRFTGDAVAVIPVRSKGALLAVIMIEGRGISAFPQDVLAFFGMLAGQAALAIENATLYARMVTLSITDGLTGLANYRHYMERSETEFARSRRYGRPLSLIYLDLDHFKEFNDRHGHLNGDEALRRLAVVLRNGLRDADIPVRCGGEEFAVILPETEIDEAVNLAERLRTSVESTWAAEGHLTVSIGVATLTDTMESFQELIKNADQALYQAKQEGRNLVRAIRP